MRFALVAILFATSAALAQAPSAEFPDGASALSPERLQESIAGKVFSVKPASGPDWRWQFKPDGYFFINVGTFADSGKWSVKESALCTEGSRIKFSCNEVRLVGAELHLKRDSGEIVRLQAK